MFLLKQGFSINQCQFEIKFALRWLPQFRNMGFQISENSDSIQPMYSNETFRLYLQSEVLFSLL